MEKYFILFIALSLHPQLIGQTLLMGCNFDQETYKALPTSPPLTTRSYESLPPSVSLKKFCPTPKEQTLPDCVGWATAFAARTVVDANQNEWMDMSVINTETFAPSYVYNQIKLKSDCSDGSYIYEALNLLAQQGTPKYKDYPYGCETPITNQDKQLAAKNKIADYRTLKSNNAIKKALLNGNPVVIGMYVSEGFGNTIGELWDGRQYGNGGGHAMCVVGYDDYKHGGAFEVMNSWGTDFADNGFVWIKYIDFLKYVNEAYEIIPLFQPVKPTPVKPNPVKTISLSGELHLEQDNGELMPVKLLANSAQNFDKVNLERSTYKLIKPYKSGTRFRIYFGARQQWAYIYLIGYNTTTKNTQLIFPFNNYSPYIGKSSEIAIPNEQYYIELDSNIGTDYLCVLYSVVPLDINSIIQTLEFESGSFTTRIKNAIKDKIIHSSDISLEKEKIAFLTKNTDKTVVPIILEFDHIN